MVKARVAVSLLSTAALCWAASLGAQGYPSKPIRVIVPSAPGGAIDVTARTLTPRLAEALKQPVYVDNRAGAQTIIGTELAAKAASDGATLLAVFDNFPLTQYMMKNVPYDAIRDFAPISLIIRGPMIVGVPPQLGVRDLKQFVQLAKSKAGDLNYGSAGIGTSSHLTVELFKLTAGIDVRSVHYKGAAPAVVDLIGGTTQLMIAASGTLINHVKSGKILALAVSAPKRIPQLPSVPAIAEFYPGFEAQSWVGLLGPAGMSREIIGRLNSEVAKVLGDPDIRRRFEDQGWEVVGGTPEYFAKWLADQSQKWVRVIRERNITLE